jgi:membrane protein implicated in regulation of membrane protease activity
MSKRKRDHKLERAALEEARRITPGKMIRLLLKSLLFSLLVVVIMVGLSLLGVPAFQNFWVQLVVMVIIYVIAYPFLMREFRPRRVKSEK